MARTLGYHCVKTGYGLWLPGDERGSWSERWDAEIGFTEPHTLHPGDPVRLRIAAERMAHPPVRLTPEMLASVERTLGRCQADSPWRIAAASLEATHLHLVLTYSGRDIETTMKWLADQTTKTIHRETGHAGPVWAKGSWRGYIESSEQWEATVQYVERHNLRRGLPARPYSFL